MAQIVNLADHRKTPQRGGNKKGTRRSFGNLRKLPSGRWQASYLGPDGVRHNAPTTFQTKGDADKWLSMESAALTEHRWKPPAPEAKAELPTFRTYAAQWLAGRELKPRTREEYRKLVGLPKDDATPYQPRGGVTLLDTFGDDPLDAITPARVREWYGQLDPDKKTRRAHLYALLRTILGTATEAGTLDANPCTLRAAGKAKRVHKIVVASTDQLATIKGQLPDRWALLVDMAAVCGLRFGEATALQRQDIDFKAGLVRVRRGVTWLDGEAIVSTPKTDAGTRDVPLFPHMEEALRQHLATWSEKGRDGLVFPAAGGGVLNHGTFHKHFRKARAEAEREDLRFHDLRHTAAVAYAEAGATVKELMVFMGHTTPTMAMNYQHAASGRAKTLAARVSERYSNA